MVNDGSIKVSKANIIDFVQDKNNANLGTEAGQTLLNNSLQEVGAGRSILLDAKGRLIAGNKTQLAAIEAGIAEVIVIKTNGEALIAHQREDLDLASDDPNNPARRLAYLDNVTSLVNLELDPAVLMGDMAAGVDVESIIPEDLLGELLAGSDADALLGGGEPKEETEIPEAETSKAAELAQEYGIEVGQVWVLDSGGGVVHRVAVGDCRDGALLERLFQEAKATLALEDPPYGMGKEGDGVANDNLYRDKLDTFIMECWQAGRIHLKDNASAYIWGNAEDLWRLWYVGGLKDSERLTFRNEIVWLKESGHGMNSEQHRMYATATERCLFFVLGERGYNNNADNYWEGWTPIREYLYGEVERLKAARGWTLGDIGAALGVSGRMIGHWITESQWEFITENHYKKLQSIARDYEGFKRDYEGFKRDELKREFYSTRATFNNTHDSMVDVWQFNRLQGAARYEHATPKPSGIVKRKIETSSKEGDIIYSPFGGTGTDLVSAEALGRSCYIVEILPQWVGVILNRWEQMTGCKAVLES